jgi:hypothetical protein
MPIFVGLKQTDTTKVISLLQDECGCDCMEDLVMCVSDDDFDIVSIPGFDKLTPFGKAVVKKAFIKIKQDAVETELIP